MVISDYITPVMLIDPSGEAWWNWVISGVQIVAGIALIATGLGVGFGAMLLSGGVMGMVTNIVGSQIGAGIGSMVNGYGAISTGISLMSFGTIGIVAGIISIGIGEATMALGANEILDGVTGNNYLQDITGWSSDTYHNVYLGLNIASTVATIAGRIGMRIAGTTNMRSAPGKSTPYGKNSYQDKNYYYDGKGNPYYSVHDIGSTSQHFHASFGRDGTHLDSYFELIMELIFGRK